MWTFFHDPPQQILSIPQKKKINIHNSLLRHQYLQSFGIEVDFVGMVQWCLSLWVELYVS